MYKVTEDTIILDVIKQDKESAGVFMAHGLYCIGCPGASMESISDAGKVHGIDVAKLVEDLNKFFQQKA